MREIKFRAWETYSKQGKIVEVKSLQFRDWLNKDGEDGANGVHFHLMQYTGLRDKNGVEIYEGDIITYGFYTKFVDSNDEVDDLDRPMNFPVEWSSPDAGWIANGSMGDRGNGVYPFEVIGNIHQNPELLEQPHD